MAEPLGEVCSVTRRLLRRGLELQTARRVNVFFSAKGWILFEQPYYFPSKFYRSVCVCACVWDRTSVCPFSGNNIWYFRNSGIICL